MLNISLENVGDAVVINDNIKITKTEGGLRLIPLVEDTMRVVGERTTKPKPLYDPHYYANGNNGLTVDASVQRALDRVIAKFESEGYELEGLDYTDIKRGITYLIENNFGRDAAYRIAGSAVNKSKESKYRIYRIGHLFKEIAEGRLSSEPVNTHTGLVYHR